MQKIENIVENIIYQYLNENILREDYTPTITWDGNGDIVSTNVPEMKTNVQEPNPQEKPKTKRTRKSTKEKTVANKEPSQVEQVQQGEGVDNNSGWNYDYTYDYVNNNSQSYNPQSFGYSVPQASNNVQEPSQQEVTPPNQEPSDMEELEDGNNYQEGPSIDYASALNNKGVKRKNIGDKYGVINMDSDYPISNALLNLVKGRYMKNSDRVFKIMRELEEIGW